MIHSGSYHRRNANQAAGAIMKSVSALFAAVIGLATLPAQAEISTEAARAGVAPFYRALNAEFVQ